MNIFGLKIRLFEKELTSIEAIETWCVKWSSLHKNAIGRGDQVINVQGFPSKENAETYAKALRDARRLLGDVGFSVEVYKQKTPSNA